MKRAKCMSSSTASNRAGLYCDQADLQRGDAETSDRCTRLSVQLELLAPNDPRPVINIWIVNQA